MTDSYLADAPSQATSRTAPLRAELAVGFLPVAENIARRYSGTARPDSATPGAQQPAETSFEEPPWSASRAGGHA